MILMTRVALQVLRAARQRITMTLRARNARVRPVVRQGDPGSSQIFTSLEDELVRLYAPKLAKSLWGMSAGAEELSGAVLKQGRWLMRVAQRSAEARARRNRAEVLKQDDWIEKHLPGM